MKEIILRPDCLECGKEILKPSDCNMELFRYGFPLHHECEKAWNEAAFLICDDCGRTDGSHNYNMEH